MGDQNAKRPDQKPGRLSMDQGPTHILDVKSLAPSSPRVKAPMPDQTIADVEVRLEEVLEERASMRGIDHTTATVSAADLTALLASHRRMKEALEEIDQPLTAMKARADAAGRHLSGLAYSIAYSASHLQAIARQALQGDAHEDR